MNDRTKRDLALVVYALTIFTSASLLFVVQPMVGKMILPHLGGSPSVWTTCMLFFQSTLVAGYVYAHVIAQKLTPQWQIGLHFILITAAIALCLPFDIPGYLIQSRSAPALWLLAALAVAIGPPLLIVSSSAPLFQHWFSFTDHPDADDPYYLYSASNVGSILALFGYPFFVERTFGLDTQTWLWALGFGVLVVLTVGCSIFIHDSTRDAEPADPEASTAEPLTWSRRGWWLLITFIPSSLMLGVTHYLSTDIASVPLLWVLPLGFYLLSFILVFARIPLYLGLYRALVPFSALLVLAATYSGYFTIAIVVFLHLWMFFLYAMYFHGQLAEDRPETEYLTEFYIWMSVGGALGGLFNALVAPVLFDWMIEYYLVLALGIAVIKPTRMASDSNSPLVEWAISLALAVAIGTYLVNVNLVVVDSPGTWFGAIVVIGAIVGIAAQFPMVQNVSVAVLMVIGFATSEHIQTAIDYERSFFAAYTVYTDEMNDRDIKVFSHGTTQHGIQATKKQLQDTPVGYYHPAGPIGDIFNQLPHKDVAVAGLGAGGLAAYHNVGAQFTFFEIDPVVEEIAREHFSYLDHCGDRCTVKIGDARKLLEKQPEDSYDLLFMDAYNSDSVPTHLLTRESVKLYLSRLKDDGVIIFHVSNRYLDIEGIVGSLAADLGLVARSKSYSPEKNNEDEALAYQSHYTIVARDKEALGKLIESPTWTKTDRLGVVWTDNFTNIVSALK
ncbi:MAG: fused MFS/spermidine synthase [Bradymonadaceae bacterium]